MPRARLAKWLAALMAAWLVAHELHVVVPGLDGFGGPVFGRWTHVGVMAVGALAVLARALVSREERLGWMLIGGALLAWTAGEAYFTSVLWDLASPPVPSPADVGYLLFPVLALGGFVALACARVRGADRLMAADAATAALAAGAVSAALVFGAVVGVVGGGDKLALATNLAYPVADLLLLATIVGIGGLQGWRVNRTWALLALGCLCFTVTDGVYLVEVAAGHVGLRRRLGRRLVGGGAALGVRRVGARGGAQRPARVDALGARPAPARLRRRRARGPRDRRGPAGEPPRRRARRAALVASITRLHLTLRAHTASLHHARGEALTDALTGLGNRRLLATDLDERFAALSGDDELMLVVFDLDGFKHYNDVFGHPAGDAALVRLAARLARHRGPRRARVPARRRRVLRAPGAGRHRLVRRSWPAAAQRCPRRATATRSAARSARSCSRRRRPTPPTRCASPTSGCTRASRTGACRRSARPPTRCCARWRSGSPISATTPRASPTSPRRRRACWA